MSWHFVERWLQKVNQHSTLIGKFWITFLIVFRIVVVSSVGDRVYSDEQSEFKCNTLQVGCNNVCFNQFSPISHIRFWSFQIIMVTTPSIVFMVYAAHNIKKKPPAKAKSSCSGPTPSPTKKIEAGEPTDDDDDKKKSKKSRPGSLGAGQELCHVIDKKKIRQSVLQDMFGEEKAAFTQNYVLYAVSVLFRTLMEVLFIFLQYKLFGIRITELYKCIGKPCPNTVDCFVSRPMEKTIFLWFMFVIAFICLALNIIEIYYLIWQFGIRRARLERKKRRLHRAMMTETSKGMDIADAEILDGGILSGHQVSPPAYRGVANLSDVDGLELIPTTLANVNTTGMAMSFSLDDAVLPHVNPNARYGVYGGGPVVHGDAPSAGGSSRSNNNAFVAPIQMTLGPDQTYLSNIKNSKTVTKHGDYYDYV